MNLNKFFLSLLTISALFTACKREEIKPDQQINANADMKDLVVEPTFDWKSTEDVQLTVKVEQANFPGEKFRINIYNDFPTIGQLIHSGITDNSLTFNTNFRVPSKYKSVWVEKISATGASELKKVDISNNLNLQFKSETVVMMKKTGSGLDCNTGCTQTYNNHNGNISVSSGQTVCLTGTYSGNVTMSGGTLRVCGNANFSGLNMNNSTSTVYFLESANVTSSNINFNNNSAKLYNYADSLVFNTSFSPGGLVYNYGAIVVPNDLNINNGSIFENNGTIYVGKNLNNNHKVVNNNYIYVNEKLHNNNNDGFVNNCQLIVMDDLHNNDVIDNYGYIYCDREFKANSNSVLNMYSKALVVTNDVTFNSNTVLEGKGTNRATFKVGDDTDFKNNAEIKGNVELCDSNGIETNSGTLSSPATFTCNNYIASSQCSAGFGTPQTSDSDGDGVTDAQDDYPNDAARAFNSYYPSANDYATYGFEDLWPGQGDYDFNDLVLSFRVKKVLNANNNVVEMFTTMMVRAIGASYDNGFGYQLDDVNASEVSNVTGYSHIKGNISLNNNKTESGNTKAVIIAFDSPEGIINRPGGIYFNTDPTESTGTFDTLEIKVSFTSPIAQSKVAMNKINPFIYVNQNRGHEVHLADFAPTAKADLTKLGTIEDNSVPSSGRYYRTATNLPFVIEVPSYFAYPKEKVAITSAYSYFASWAQSSGNTYTNWYDNLNGYRNNNNIY